MPAATPLPASEETLARVRFDSNGLVPAIIQQHGTGVVLMLGWMNLESLRRTFDTGRVWFWSRSRSELWCKGETSGNGQYVRAVYLDCDGDALLLEVEQDGVGACHTGALSCFFEELADAAD